MMPAERIDGLRIGRLRAFLIRGDMSLVGTRRAVAYLARRHTRWWRKFFI
jgi:hypothetical protein